ncbi:MAG TPA: phosphomannomutase/phosphoglucomutase [Acidothermaceae bacterium]
MQDLSKIVKAYDIRGVVPDELDEETARAVGAAFAIFTKAPQIVIAHDMRESSVPLSQAVAEGAASQGTDVIMAGLASTDMIYFAAGSLDIPGVMLTASHNPAKYNGIKLCLAGARPVGQETGLLEIRALIENGIPTYDGKPGTITTHELVEDYAVFLRHLVDLSGIRPLKVVVDAGNGMGGYTVPIVLKDLPLDIVPMYFELDGNFPNHEANPIDPKNTADLQAKVLETHADIGLAFDGDADRCFVIDERGQIVSPSVITALVAVRELKKSPGSAIIHNLITSKAVAEIVREHGGVPVRSRVGHSFIKATMGETNAVFGGEHSGHFYFRDFWRADSGMLAALHVLAALGETPPGTKLSEFLAEYSRYVQSGEINSTVQDQAAVIAKVRAVYIDEPGVTIDDLDGMTVTTPTWWFNLRASNTEPLLRLNVEADDQATLDRVRDEVLALIRGEGQ